MRWVYSFFLYLITPYLFFRLRWKGRKLAAYKERINERFMLGSFSPLDVDIWIHAVSLGEVIAIIPLVDELLDRNKSVLLTTMTPTGAAKVEQHFGAKVIHRYIPYDISFAVKRFFKKIKPKVAVIVETELWPNLIYFTRKAGIPLLLINARLSPKSYQGYRKLRFLIKPILQKFTHILVQTETDALRFKNLGAKAENVKVIGNLKFDLKTKHVNNDIFMTLKNLWGEKRPILIAASTHENEEELILSNLKQLQKDIPNILLLIAPRHPERFNKVEELSKNLSFKTGLRSQIQSLSNNPDVVIIDSLGELLGFYQISDYAFVGGSLVPVGGHNVLEPIAMQIPVLSGPYVHNFKDICKELSEASAIILINDAKQLVVEVNSLHSDRVKKMQLINQANEILQKNKGALKRYLKIIESYLI